MIRFGLIGPGAMGTAHLQTRQNMADQASIIAVASPDEEASLATLDRLGLAQTPLLADWKGLCKRQDIDAIIVASPDNYHAEMTCYALECGKHVLCEKPMALCVDDCQRMIESGEKADRLLMIGQVKRFWPCYQAMKEIVQSGAHGEIQSVSLRSFVPKRDSWMNDVNLSGGLLMTLGIHDVDTALWFFGEPKDVIGADHLIEGCSEAAYRIWKYEKFPLMIECARQAGIKFCSEFHIRFANATLTHQTNNKGNCIHLFTSDESRAIEIPQLGGGLYLQDEYFIECIENNTPADLCPPAGSMKAVRLVRQTIHDDNKTIRKGIC